MPEYIVTLRSGVVGVDATVRVTADTPAIARSNGLKKQQADQPRLGWFVSRVEEVAG